MFRKLVVGGLFAGAIVVSCSQAFAWSCVASSSDGAQGWSEQYVTEGAAEQRALSECGNVTTTGDCQVQQCVPDNGNS